MSRKQIVLASANKGKIAEYAEILSPLGYSLLTPDDFPLYEDPIEDGMTYEENALIKAKALRNLTSLPVLADDSGLEINALGRFPGLYSARFQKQMGSKEAAYKEIFSRLEGKRRDAQFVCVICYLEENSAKPQYFKGICPGRILFSPHGNNGFGYDPIFHSDEADIDFGVASEEIKNAYSHRGKALKELLKALS